MIESYLVEGRQEITDNRTFASPSPIHASDGTTPNASSKKLQKNVRFMNINGDVYRCIGTCPR